MEIDDVYILVRDVHNDDLLLVDHGEEVYVIGVLLLKEGLAIGIHMHDALICARFDDLAEDEGIIVSSGETKDLDYLFLEHQPVLFLEKHFLS